MFNLFLLFSLFVSSGDQGLRQSPDLAYTQVNPGRIAVEGCCPIPPPPPPCPDCRG